MAVQVQNRQAAVKVGRAVSASSINQALLPVTPLLLQWRQEIAALRMKYLVFALPRSPEASARILTSEASTSDSIRAFRLRGAATIAGRRKQLAVLLQITLLRGRVVLQISVAMVSCNLLLAKSVTKARGIASPPMPYAVQTAKPRVAGMASWITSLSSGPEKPVMTVHSTVRLRLLSAGPTASHAMCSTSSGNGSGI